MYDRILVPLDGSKTGEAALPVIEELVSKLWPGHKVEVTLFQVVLSTHWVVTAEASVPVPYTEQELRPIKQKAQEYLENTSASLRSKGAIVKTKVSIGRPEEEIIKAAAEINADLIAMSTHGRSGISRWALGSVTDKVLRAGKIPVLTVRVPKGSESMAT